jgi:hypothetical protein
MSEFENRIERCRTCRNAPIIWARTVKNRLAIPVNAEPDPLRGNIELKWQGGLIEAHIVKPTAERNDLRTSHFATCPKANMWRK